MSVFRSSMRQANVCRPEWKVICLFMPAFSVHTIKCLHNILTEFENGKIRVESLPRAPMYCSACGEISKYSKAPVFCWWNTMRVNSPCFDTSLHLRATTSEKRSPVKHEKKNIRSTSLLPHGVAASKRSSSNVRNWRSCADSSMRNVRIRLSVSAGTSPSRTAQAIKCRNLAKVFFALGFWCLICMAL